MKMSEDRLISIDSLRGLAASAVLWFHLTNTVNNYPISQILRDSGSYGWIGVDVFFVISGFIIPYSLWCGNFVFRDHWRAFFLKRILRIEPTYLISIIFTICLALVSNAILAKSVYTFDTAQLAAHFLYLNALLGYEWINPVYWTLAIEFQYYILIGFIYKALQSKNGRFFLLLGAFLLAYFIRDANFIFKFSGLFLMGIFVFLFHIKAIGNTEFACLFGGSLVLSLINLDMAATFAGLTTSFFILYVRFPEFKFLTFFGMISYSLYLFHYPIVEKLMRYGKYLGMGTLDQILVSIITLFVSILVATFFYKFVEKPSMRISSKIRYI
ncbi:MAG: acyltransferase [Gallionella sp.]|jgi:peptidoglycan/LPS O-acetylase OafA/YrhL